MCKSGDKDESQGTYAPLSLFSASRRGRASARLLINVILRREGAFERSRNLVREIDAKAEAHFGSSISWHRLRSTSVGFRLLS